MRRRPGGESIPLRCRLPSSPILASHPPPLSTVACRPVPPPNRFSSARRLAAAVGSRCSKSGGSGRAPRLSSCLRRPRGEKKLAGVLAVKQQASAPIRPPIFGSLAACVLVLSASQVRQCWLEESHQGIQAGGVEEPALFQDERVRGPMETRVKKRKQERDLLSIQEEGTIVQSPQTGEISVRGADLESGEDSSDSVTSDAGSAKAAPDDVLHIAHALYKVCAKSPRAVIDFVRRVSPATVGRSIDWDVVREEESSKMGDGRSRWTDMEVRVFLESCLEEMAAFTITSNSPKPQAWQNLIHKMYTKCKKKQNKGVLSFRNDPLKHIDLHHAVFSGRTVVGNHSAVAGAAPAAPQGAVQWQTIDMAQLAAAYRPPPPTPPPTAADRGKGKRPAANTPASGSSSKKSRSDSAGLALERIADIREQSYQSHAA
uniref:Myb/SANT-like domain-containing protein n=1 Tax=Oryza sativa subsp. japonica TaxID=39947 RepID=Q84NX1_ORYSJ|nr:unknown protein [Oryza sativa Japonica Group]